MTSPTPGAGAPFDAEAVRPLLGLELLELLEGLRDDARVARSMATGLFDLLDGCGPDHMVRAGGLRALVGPLELLLNTVEGDLATALNARLWRQKGRALAAGAKAGAKAGVQ